ncbi:hypothetical protein QUA41_07765 [Microcoleus sp. Pol11C1]|uniref:hypothetical protein n=1 Tax=unclassified Microcoleus TaxID=2642155 RepID=UPI002FD5A687
MSAVDGIFTIPDWINQGLESGKYVRVGSVIRDAQKQPPEIVAMWREVNPNLSQVLSRVSQCGSVASILTLAVSCIGFSVVLQRLEEIEQRLKRIEHKIDVIFYADFRAALQSAHNAFTMKNYDNRIAFAIQAVSGFNNAHRDLQRLPSYSI